MKLVVVSPQHTYEYDVAWIEVCAPSGSLIIREGHAPIILPLVAGFNFSFVLHHTGEKKIIALIRSGFLEVTRTSVSVIISQESAFEHIK